MTYTKPALLKGYIEDHGAGQVAIYVKDGEFHAYAHILAVTDDGRNFVLQHDHGTGPGQRFSIAHIEQADIPDLILGNADGAYPIHAFRTIAEWGADYDDERAQDEFEGHALDDFSESVGR